MMVNRTVKGKKVYPNGLTKKEKKEFDEEVKTQWSGIYCEDLKLSFVWGRSKQGHEYWQKIYERIYTKHKPTTKTKNQNG